MGQPPLLWAPWARASPPAQESISPSDLISISPLSASNRPSLPIPALPDTMFSFEVGRGLFSPRRLADGDKHHIPAPLSHCSQTELEPRAAPPSAPLRDAARARCEGRTDGRRDGWMDGCLHPLPGHGARRQGTAAPTGDGDKRDQGRTEHNEESDGGWGRGRRRATRGQKKGRSFLFSRLNNPISLSLSSDGRCSSPWIIFVASSGPVPTAPYPYAGDPRTGRSVPACPGPSGSEPVPPAGPPPRSARCPLSVSLLKGHQTAAAPARTLRDHNTPRAEHIPPGAQHPPWRTGTDTPAEPRRHLRLIRGGQR
ncbi:uncharacterized protein LOC128852667 isoform X2 [Cuculus canorus]|uniref:uncharacterized protein LOC128852667 isoform X2 n=1 Tax=Cuculus canorus TaxID=55661 RepID=UPI0023AB3412|nr:uncharacterized protein LOC128852667 isoform X2 [Cuculus canorus]